MGVRETLNKQPAITTGATIGIIGLALVFIIYQVSGSGRVRVPTQAYFTVDDGASYFADDIKRVPPFDYEGKLAVKADVFACGSRKFVGFLEQYTPDAKKMIDDARARNDPNALSAAMSTGLEVKAPLTGNTGWIRAGLAAAAKVANVSCSEPNVLPEPVMP